jgi:hypothetical protein
MEGALLANSQSERWSLHTIIATMANTPPTTVSHCIVHVWARSVRFGFILTIHSNSGEHTISHDLLVFLLWTSCSQSSLRRKHSSLPLSPFSLRVLPSSMRRCHAYRSHMALVFDLNSSDDSSADPTKIKAFGSTPSSR